MWEVSTLAGQGAQGVAGLGGDAGGFEAAEPFVEWDVLLLAEGFEGHASVAHTAVSVAALGGLSFCVCALPRRAVGLTLHAILGAFTVFVAFAAFSLARGALVAGLHDLEELVGGLVMSCCQVADFVEGACIVNSGIL